VQLTATVLAETTQNSRGIEYHTLTALEAGPAPLLQMIDYTLRPEEAAHRGKLVGKVIVLQVESIRSLFSGRPQLAGRILEVRSATK